MRLRSARAVAQIEVLWIARPRFGRLQFPSGQNGGRVLDRKAVVETGVAVVLGEGAPVRRVNGRSHEIIPSKRVSWLDDRRYDAPPQ